MHFEIHSLHLNIWIAWQDIWKEPLNVVLQEDPKLEQKPQERTIYFISFEQPSGFLKFTLNEIERTAKIEHSHRGNMIAWILPLSADHPY